MKDEFRMLQDEIQGQVYKNHVKVKALHYQIHIVYYFKLNRNDS